MKNANKYRIVKKSIKYFVVLFLIAGMSAPQLSFGQAWGGRKTKASFWDNWAINLNGGLTSFYGDLSTFDSEIIDKLMKESGPAFGGILSKYILSNKIGFSGQLLYGNLQGANTNNTFSFEASFIEYNFHSRFNLVNLISRRYNPKFGFELYGGIGQFIFQATRYDSELVQIGNENTGTPEFVYFFGAGISYKVIDKLAITVDMAMRQAQNDKLDDFIKNDNFDYYSYINIGVTYHIESIIKSNSKRGGRSIYRAPGKLPMRRRR
jgi:hypothetical protein